MLCKKKIKEKYFLFVLIYFFKVILISQFMLPLIYVRTSSV